MDERIDLNEFITRAITKLHAFRDQYKNEQFSRSPDEPMPDKQTFNDWQEEMLNWEQ